LPSPYDAGAEALAEGLAAAGLKVAAGRTEPGVIWLPSAHGRPAACDALLADASEASDETELAPWYVTCYQPKSAQWLDLLCACVGKRVLAPGVMVGYDLRYWTVAMRFGGGIVARQQFLPGVSEREGRYRACWRPLLGGPDAERSGALSRAMPPVCRAMALERQPAPARPASAILSDFLEDVVDALVRASAGGALPQPPPARRRTASSAHLSLHDQWLAALSAPDGGILDGDRVALADLAAQVQQWWHPLTVTAASPFRLCFRLDEPGIGEGAGPASDEGFFTASEQPWAVTYHLQATDDPSLLVPASDAWKMTGRKASVLKRGDFRPQEYLLSALGQASGICPPVEESLREKRPGGYQCDEAGAFAFLSESADTLEQAGFGVMLPAWWTRKGTKLRLSARAAVTDPGFQTPASLSLNTLVNFEWRIALGDETLSRQELEELARLKAPLVKLRGQWVHISRDEIGAALEFWRKKQGQEVTLRELIGMALGGAEAPGSIPVTGVEARGWIGDLLSRLEGGDTFTALDAPQGFQGALRPYQARGYSWLAFLRQWGLGACLADDMGLGKTVQTLALIQREWCAEGCPRPTLLVCPTSVVGNWQREAARFTPDMPVIIHHGTRRSKGKEFATAAEKCAIVVTSYALLHRDAAHFAEVPWAGVILDEAQNIKNPSTKQARAARSLDAEYRIALTGTPVENNVGDLWSIMEFLNPGFLGSRESFRSNYLLPIQTRSSSDAAMRLKRLTGPFILRRLKTDPTVISDLPAKNEMNVFCTLTREQASLYAAVTSEAERALDEAEDMERRGIILATLTKLKQVCNHPAHLMGDNSPLPGRSGKLARLTEMVEEVLGVGERALIFTQYTQMGEMLVKHLEETFGEETLFLHGGATKLKRDRMVERFQQDPDAPSLFVLSLKAGGTGLNLTRANHVFHFDRWWNPAVENQATDRAFRIGQTRNVQVHKFVCMGTVEERINEMIEKKKAVADKVVGTGEAWLTELSTAELKKMFALAETAVAE
jgi:SNF2 family DNA or RNA helicase